MENQEHQDFNEDAAFDQAAESLKSGELTVSSEPSDAEKTNQDTPDQRENADNQEQPQNEDEPPQGEEAFPDWLASATDEVKENFRKLQAENKRLDHMAKSQRGRVGALSKKYQQAQAALEKAKNSQGNFSADIGKLSEDYPELASILTRIVDDQQQRFNGISEPLSQIAEATAQDLSQQELDGSIDYVSRIVPDANQILADPQFFAWVDRQPNGIKALFTSNDPDDAVYLLSEYKKATSAVREQRVKRSQQLSAMSLPNARTAPKGSEELDEDALFNRIAAEERRKQRY